MGKALLLFALFVPLACLLVMVVYGASVSMCFREEVLAHSERRAPCSYCVWLYRQINAGKD